MNVLLIFLDGVGIGSDDPEVNPLARFELPTITSLIPLKPTGDSVTSSTHDRVFAAIDANLDVDGLPQSGTGQASLFTGINCAQLAGRHFGPYPHSATRETLADKNVFRQTIDVFPEEHAPATFVNAYPPPFFTYGRERNRWTVTTRACLDTGIQIRNLDDLAAGNALAADITGRRLADAGFTVEPITEDDAAGNLVRLARSHRLTLFEFFLTDKVGHSQSLADAGEVLRSLDRFLESVLEEAARAPVTLLITSDHGNLEDLTVRTHTRNPVPFVAVGPDAQRFRHVTSILDVTPAIIGAFSEGGRVG